MVRHCNRGCTGEDGKLHKKAGGRDSYLQICLGHEREADEQQQVLDVRDTLCEWRSGILRIVGPLHDGVKNEPLAAFLQRCDQ